MAENRDTEQLLADLDAAEAALEAAARGVPAALLHQRPAPDEWSVGEILAHMADSPRFYVAEVRRLVREGGGAFGRPLDDPERLGPVEHHGHDSLDEAIARNRAGVAVARALLAELSARDLAVRGVHPRAGEFDVAGLIERFIVAHRRAHAEQIHQTVAALDSQASGG